MKDLKSQFIDWLATKPADEEYNYFDYSFAPDQGCAIYRFCADNGYPKEVAVGIDFYGERSGICKAALTGPYTFGALRERLLQS